MITRIARKLDELIVSSRPPVYRVQSPDLLKEAAAQGAFAGTFDYDEKRKEVDARLYKAQGMKRIKLWDAKVGA